MNGIPMDALGRWPWHYRGQLGAIRTHIWAEAGKSQSEMDSQPGFFDIAYKPSPFLKRVADLPIYGDKAELAQFDGAFKIAEIDIPESVLPAVGHPAHRGA
jgi:hypothetical protein